MSGPGDDVFTQLHKAAVPVRPTLANNARYWGTYIALLYRCLGMYPNPAWIPKVCLQQALRIV